MAARLIIAGCRLYLNPPAVDAGVRTEKPGLRKRSPILRLPVSPELRATRRVLRRSRIGT
jgi:hypothetical protein